MCPPLPSHHHPPHCHLQVRQVSDEEHKLAVAVKSSKDERYGSHWVVTHDGRCMRCYTADSLADFKRIMGPAYYKFQVNSCTAWAEVALRCSPRSSPRPL